MGLVAERTNVHHYGGLIGLFSSSIEIPYIVNSEDILNEFVFNASKKTEKKGGSGRRTGLTQ